LVDTAAERGDVEHAGIGRTRGVEQDMRWSRFRHARIRLSPSAAAIAAETDATPVIQDGIVAPHLRAGKIVRVTIDAPHTAAHRGIEHDPVSCIQPLARDSGCGTY